MPRFQENWERGSLILQAGFSRSWSGGCEERMGFVCSGKFMIDEVGWNGVFDRWWEILHVWVGWLYQLKKSGPWGNEWMKLY